MTDRERKTFEKYLRAILGELNRRKVKGSGAPGRDLQKVATPELLALALNCSEALREKKFKVIGAVKDAESKAALYGLQALVQIEDKPEDGERG